MIVDVAVTHNKTSFCDCRRTSGLWSPNTLNNICTQELMVFGSFSNKKAEVFFFHYGKFPLLCGETVGLLRNDVNVVET